MRRIFGSSIEYDCGLPSLLRLWPSEVAEFCSEPAVLASASLGATLESIIVTCLHPNMLRESPRGRMRTSRYLKYSPITTLRATPRSHKYLCSIGYGCRAPNPNRPDQGPDLPSITGNQICIMLPGQASTCTSSGQSHKTTGDTRFPRGIGSPRFVCLLARCAIPVSKLRTLLGSSIPSVLKAGRTRCYSCIGR